MIRYLLLPFILTYRSIVWTFALLTNENKIIKKVMGFDIILNPTGFDVDFFEKSIHKQIFLDGIREKESTLYLEEFLEPDDNILDLGANIGYYVLVESTIISEDATIYAVEPAENNYSTLKQNIALNDLKNVETEQLALSDEKGTSKLYTGKASNLYSLHMKSGFSEDDYIEIETLTIDQFAKNRESINCLRMDIEGHEVSVINGMGELLDSEEFTKIFVEIHPHNVSYKKMKEFLQVLENHGFGIEKAISRDSFARQFLGHTKVENMSIDELINDERVVSGENAFQLFLKKDDL